MQSLATAVTWCATTKDCIFGLIPQAASIGFRDWGNKKEHKLSLAPYPDLSLKDARLKRDEIQTARAKCENPVSKAGGFPQVFSEVVHEWLKVRMADRAESCVKTVRIRLNKYILPEIEAVPLKENTSADILKICRSIDSTRYD